jgi:lipid-A-disaccharide synthase-like uncharacterized protein
MNDFLLYTLGFFSQALFFARNIAQWMMSEKKGEVMSPVVYWQISLGASILMLTYGILRNDFAIVLGQIIVYSIYIRNLQLKHAWKKMPFITRYLAIALPLIYLGWLIFGNTYNFRSILNNKDVPILLMIWGTAGQIIFTFRFIYQWAYSEKRKDSFLPMGFWIISIIGSIMIFSYAVFRLDPVLFAAHSIGLFIYIRNVMLLKGKRGMLSNLPNFKFIERFLR